MPKNKKPDVYQIVTDQILEALDKGVVPWRKPWKGGSPMNFKTKKAYRGLNSLLLSMSDYDQPYWATFKQINEMGGKVRKGESGTIIVFWRKLDGVKEEENKETGEKELKSAPFFVLRYYRVWNIEQTEGIELPKIENEHVNPIEECEAVVSNYKGKPEIKTEGIRACYSPQEDIVRMPNLKKFETSEGYYATLFHELVHSTGHEKRLDRKLSGMFGSETYSKEELIAEFGSAFLCGHVGIAPSIIENATSYIDGWRKALTEDKKLLVSSASKAQKASDFILGDLDKSNL